MHEQFMDITITAPKKKTNKITLPNYFLYYLLWYEILLLKKV